MTRSKSARGEAVREFTNRRFPERPSPHAEKKFPFLRIHVASNDLAGHRGRFELTTYRHVDRASTCLVAGVLSFRARVGALFPYCSG